MLVLVFLSQQLVLCQSGSSCDLTAYLHGMPTLAWNWYMTGTMFDFWSGPEVIKKFSGSTQLSMEFFLIINVNMPIIVGILTFMSRKKWHSRLI